MQLSNRHAFPHSNLPFLAIVTESSACDSIEHLEKTMISLTKAVSTNQVDLISIRVDRHDTAENPQQYQRVVSLAKALLQLSITKKFRAVVSSNWVDAAAEAGAHGVHVKEAQWPQLIPEIRRQFEAAGSSQVLLGTSLHSLESARMVGQVYRPDYIFVGTCYKTASHPEKEASDLEGPELPGQVCRELDKIMGSNRPNVFAIGGIDAGNCNEPVAGGADGVAVIRSVSEGADPAQTVHQLVASMAAA
jgi:thiamine-phosphate diphosphorylase